MNVTLQHSISLMCDFYFSSFHSLLLHNTYSLFYFLLLFVGIGVTKSDLSDETAQLLFNAAIQLLAKPTRFRFVEKMVSNIYSAEECAIALKLGEKENRMKSIMGMNSTPLSADDDIYL